MKKIMWISTVTAALFFAGCSDQTKEEVKQAAHSAGNDAAKASETVKARAGEKMEEAKRAAAEAVERVKANSKAMEKAAREATAEAAAAVEKKAAEIKQKMRPKPAAQRVAPDKEGAALFVKCAGCHGRDGRTRALGKSALIAGQSAEELKQKLEAYKAGKRNADGMGSLMQGQVAGLNDAQIAVLADYIAKMKK